MATGLSRICGCTWLRVHLLGPLYSGQKTVAGRAILGALDFSRRLNTASIENIKVEICQWFCISNLPASHY